MVRLFSSIDVFLFLSELVCMSAAPLLVDRLYDDAFYSLFFGLASSGITNACSSIFPFLISFLQFPFSFVLEDPSTTE